MDMCMINNNTNYKIKQYDKIRIHIHLIVSEVLMAVVQSI